MARRYLITGGARGIGLGIARRLAGDGAQVVIADLDGRQASEAAASLPGVPWQPRWRGRPPSPRST